MTTVLVQTHGANLSVWVTPDGRLEALRVQFGASEERRLAVARALVLGKVRNSGWALRRLGRVERLDPAGVASAGDVEALRGHEAAVARAYFAALGRSLLGWGFAGRAYRPTPDPVNAALSFAYTLLLGRTLGAVARVGLHPALGTMHVSHGRRPALALDVMEPFRAAVCDVLVVGLLRSGRLPANLFEDREAGTVHLGRAGCALVADAFAERVQVWGLDVALLRQVRAVLQGWGSGVCVAWTPPVRA